MKSRIKELESALAQSVLENRMLETTIEVADQSLGTDIKKNFGRNYNQGSSCKADQQAGGL
nr:hypothetical protein [Candidatus Electrothrix aestuarii]